MQSKIGEKRNEKKSEASKRLPDKGFGGIGYRGREKVNITVANEQSKDKGAHGDPSSAHTLKEGGKKVERSEDVRVKDVRKSPCNSLAI